MFACHAAGCGERGNILDFVAGMESVDLRSAAAELAGICSCSLAPAKNPTQKKTRSKSDKKPTQDLEHKKKRSTKGSSKRDPAPEPEAKATNTPLSFQLTLDPEHEYGLSRSLSPAVISQLEMGYSNRGIMKGRWCVPLHNAEGDFIAYCGRYASEEVPEEQTKYLLPKGFKKNKVLFNLHRIAGQTEEAILVEGIFDTARLHGLAMPAVGLFGTSVSDEQIALLREHGIKRITVMLDGGFPEKAERKLVLLLSRWFYVRSVVLPAGEDPASVSEDFLRKHVPVVSG